MPWILGLAVLVASAVGYTQFRSGGRSSESPGEVERQAVQPSGSESTGAGASVVPGGLLPEEVVLDRVISHLDYLASAELQGRGNGTPGAEVAATYIADQFELAGLLPAGWDGFYHDYHVYTGVRVQGAIGMRDQVRGYEYVKDYGPLGLSSDGQHQSDLVFVGYGVTAPEYNYDDYAGVDVEGKIVLAFLGEPGMRDPQSPFDGTAPTPYSDLYTKAVNAAAHGAAGLLLTAGPQYARGPDRVWRISQEEGFRKVEILVCHVSRAAAASLVEPGGLSLMDIQAQIDGSHTPSSRRIANQQVELMIALRRLDTNLRSLVAKIPGRSEQSVLLLANYDGFGLGDNNAEPIFHPSANENASGVAALLEIARILAAGPKPEKTIYFGCFSGGRLSSVGANEFVRNGVVDPEKIDLVVNQFSLGSTNQMSLEVMGVASGAGLEEVVREANEGLRAPVALVVRPAISRSGDHIPFYKEEIPTLTVFGGAFDEYGTPLDTPDRIDQGNLLRRTKYLVHLLQLLSASDREYPFQR